jgi:two-component system LytT family sensor kinase
MNAVLRHTNGSELLVDPNLVGELVGYGVGAILALLLLMLVAHSSERKQTPRVFLAVCALVWNLGGLVRYGVIVAGGANNDFALQLTNAVTFSIAGLWPVCAVAVWLDNDALSKVRRQLGTWLYGISIATGWLITLAQVGSIWIFLRPESGGFSREFLKSDFIRECSSYNALLIIGMSAWLLLRGQLVGWLQKLSVTAILLGVAISTASIVSHVFFHLPTSIDHAAVILKHQSLMLTVIGSLFYFARFRSLDVFVKLSLRVLLAAALALVASHFAFGPLARMAAKTVAPHAVAVAAFTALIGLVLFLVQSFSATTDIFVERQIFRRPDYREVAKQFREKLGTFGSEAELFAAAEQFVRATLELEAARILPRAALSRLSGMHGLWEPTRQEISNYGADLVAPIVLGNHKGYFLVLVKRNRQHILLTIDLDFVREIVEIVGRRLDAMEHEKERIEGANQEAQLAHQVVSAELRALRAQVNPHFLFNALNTIAALIPPEPEKAELMTVRLAKVFRHVLTHADRSFSSIEEEIDFVRTYLEIEEVRFGDRLRIQFDVSEAVAGTTVPSLILQPLVENALKHGLAPKLGDNELIIRVGLSDGFLSLSVEDNGVGLRNTSDRNPGASTGVGLRNVEERLHTIYGQRASLVLENVPRGGSRAVVLIPARIIA